MRADRPGLSPGALEAAVARLRAGGVVLHPTAGLWGLAADPKQPEALARLRALKGLEPGRRPFVVLVEAEWLPGCCALDRLEAKGKERLRLLTGRFWPGPLSLVLPAAEALCPVAAPSPDGHRVALRQDAHPAARALVRAFGGPLVSSSANLGGHPPPRALGEIPEELVSTCALLDAPPAPGGRPSTLLDLCVDPPGLLRQGAVSAADLERALGARLPG